MLHNPQHERTKELVNKELNNATADYMADVGAVVEHSFVKSGSVGLMPDKGSLMLGAVVIFETAFTSTIFLLV